MAGSYFPLDDRPFRLRMGLRPLDLAEWLEPDEQAADDLAMKQQLVAERYDDVVAIVDEPNVHAACDELWSLVEPAARGSVLQEGASAPLLAVQNPDDHHPIVRAGLATQEDWAVMAPVGGRLVLAAACVCFPTRWVLATRIGKPMAAVHEHVAYYDEHLSRPVDSFFERLTVDRPVWRLNWNLMDDPTLFQPVAGPAASVAPDEVGDRIWLRIERQTLRRLPETGAIVFGIRIHQRPLSALVARPDQLATLRTAIANLPPETFAYKSLGGFADALDTWIGARTTNVRAGPIRRA